MSLIKIALFAFAAVFIAGFPHANAAPRGTVIHGHPSAITLGTLVYGPEDVLFEHSKGGLQAD